MNEQVIRVHDGWMRNCSVCQQAVRNGSAGYGRHCDWYCEERGELCYAIVKLRLREADAVGDGPMVNALCQYGRAKWGPNDIDW